MEKKEQFSEMYITIFFFFLKLLEVSLRCVIFICFCHPYYLNHATILSSNGFLPRIHTYITSEKMNFLVKLKFSVFCISLQLQMLYFILHLSDTDYYKWLIFWWSCLHAYYPSLNHSWSLIILMPKPTRIPSHTIPMPREQSAST